jgi:hypothetical protein
MGSAITDVARDRKDWTIERKTKLGLSIGMVGPLPCPCAIRASSACELPEHHNIEIVPFSSRHNSTTMDPIQEVIEDIELHEGGERLSYRKAAKKFNVDRTTLSRQHQGKQTSDVGKAERQALLHP